MPKIQKGEFPYGHFFKMISGKWKPYILVAIDYEGSIRFNAILKFWGEISSKVLYQNLRELEEDQLICRFSDPDVKQHVEYRLTENGKRIMPVIKEIYKYSIDDMIDKDILIDSRAFDYYNPARRNEEQKKVKAAAEKSADSNVSKPKASKAASKAASETSDNSDSAQPEASKTASSKASGEGSADTGVPQPKASKTASKAGGKTSDDPNVCRSKASKVIDGEVSEAADTKSRKSKSAARSKVAERNTAKPMDLVEADLKSDGEQEMEESDKSVDNVA